MQKETQEFELIAKTLAGLEDILANELKEIGAEDIQVLTRAVGFKGDKEIMYKANYLCRTAIKILKPFASFLIRNEDDLYKEIKKIDWWDYMDVDDTLAVDCTLSASSITHSKYASLKVKDAIVDKFREKFDKRPSVDIIDPTLRINIHIFRDNCSVSFDSSGVSLHKRGYRKATDMAPINELLAAGMILLSGWKKDCNFIDPMCGSGTILIEAALIANNIPSGYYRKFFGFEHWKDFDKDLWEKIKKEASLNITEFEHRIIGSDKSAKAIQIARENIKSAKLHKDIELNIIAFEELIPPEGGGIIVTNPPYGERLKVINITELYSLIGDSLKKKFTGFNVWILSSDNNALKKVGLRTSRKIPLFNAKLECKYVKFEIYKGSLKRKNNPVD
ncbi:MAG: RNA methyltransferase [Bacteroidales bacterium]|nr:RNA methyltransferase [Bacteroidales bacterium]